MENNTTPMKQINEIWITKTDSEVLALPLGLGGINGLITIEDNGGQVKYLSEQSVNEMLAEKDREIPKWIPVTTKPEFDGEYLCSVIETEECGTSHIKQRVLSNHFNVWMVKANQSVLFWMPLPEQP